MGFDRKQALAALEAADRVRYRRADLKDAIHADPSWATLRDVIAGRLEPELVAGMRVLEAMLAAPALGPEKAKRLLVRAAGEAGGRFDPLVTFGGLTAPRRDVILAELVPMRRRLTDAYVARLAATPRGTRSDVRDAVRRAWGSADAA